MKILGFIALFVFAVTLAVLLAGQLGLLRGQAPKDLGVHDGKLKPPSPTPNSVSSQAGMYPYHPQRSLAAIDPIRPVGSLPDTLERIAQVLQQTPHTVIVQRDADYLYARCSTEFLRFTDDLEFWIDPRNQVIQVRSASRLGSKDFGVNRARVETIRAQLLKG